jgi:ribosomal protein L11 methyltransferase
MHSLNKVTLELTLASAGVKMAKAMRQAFSACGIPAAKLAEALEQEEIRLSYYPASRAEARALRHELSKLVPRQVRVSQRTLLPADWQTKWKRDFRPFHIIPRIRIVPLWLKGKVPPLRHAKDIFIDSTMSFGTGMHPTTQAMAAFIAKYRGRFARFLDIGTGTGILALIAAENGAQTLEGVDISPDAIVTARHNFKVNGLRWKRLTAADFRNVKTGTVYDFVAANLLSQDLIKMRDAIISCVAPGKYLAVSGIWKDDVRRLTRHFDVPSLRRLAITRKSGWAAVLYQKDRDLKIWKE